MTTNDRIGATHTDRPAERYPGAVALPDDQSREESPWPEVRRAPASVSVGDRSDLVRWGPVWAGTLTALATFLLLELAFFALGWLTLNQDAPGPSSSVAWMTGVAGTLAFLLGGLTAGATARRKGLDSGLLHGILVWALTITGIVLLTLLGGAGLFGAFSGVLGQITAIQNAVGRGDANIPPDAISNARDVAGWAVLALGIFIASSAVGGVLGAKLWPRGGHDATVTASR